LPVSFKQVIFFVDAVGLPAPLSICKDQQQVHSSTNKAEKRKEFAYTAKADLRLGKDEVLAQVRGC